MRMAKHSKNERLLMSAISENDEQKCCLLVDTMTKRQLNKLVRNEDSNSKYTLTPLFNAVMKGQHKIVQVLISKGAKVDRQVYIENGSTLLTESALVWSLKHCDDEMTKILLFEGRSDVMKRVAGSRVQEEEGGSLQFTKWQYPLQLITSAYSVNLLEMLLGLGFEFHTVFGDQKHTCLCETVNGDPEKQSHDELFEIVRFIVNNGGILCPGEASGELYHHDGICHCFRSLIFRAIDSLQDEDENDDYIHFKCLKLISYTDYVHSSSTFYKTLQCVLREIGLSLNDKNEQADKGKWLLDYTKCPSSLKHICRIAIRSTIRRFRPEKCETLPVPSSLQSFICLNNDLSP